MGAMLDPRVVRSETLVPMAQALARPRVTANADIATHRS
jgi:hypothetical protein